ncbi:baseplate J/gp47 family protein [Yersinia alsatica]|uniref:baseplate J/gp47 family protein n=1 Tax=Yersinia alsatica TaxID=2890317 RepID=UPI0011A8232C|nr:baseplate J/gp47 family protein [Yersinia alsatica]
MTTNVPAIVFTDKGLTLPDEIAILAGRMADINTAFGGGVNQQLSTPQGQIAQSDTAIIGDKNNQIALMANQVNPDYSSGRWQDAIGRIYFMNRISASGTVVTGRCTGLVGTVIPIGAMAQDNSGFLYAAITNGPIPETGFIDIDFQCTTTGPIACPANTLSRIYNAIIGWDTIDNALAGTPGVDVESRADFEARRRNSVAANAVNSPQSIFARVLAVPDVIDAYVIDNPTGAAVNVGSTNYSVIAHSVYVACAGGDSADIAAAIWNKKSLGCSYNGDTSYTIEDMNYSPPRPQYLVKWVTPTAIPIYFDIQIANNSALPSNIIGLIQSTIINAFNGADGGSRARIGATIYASRYYSGIASVSNNVNIQSVLLGTVSPGLSTSATIGIDQRPTLDAANITVTLV